MNAYFCCCVKTTILTKNMTNLQQYFELHCTSQYYQLSPPEVVIFTHKLFSEIRRQQHHCTFKWHIRKNRMFFKMNIALVLTFMIVGSVTAAGNSTADTPTTQKPTTTPKAAPTSQSPPVSTPSLQEGKKCNIINRCSLVKSSYNHSSKLTDWLNVSIVNRLDTTPSPPPFGGLSPIWCLNA